MEWIEASGRDQDGHAFRVTRLIAEDNRVWAEVFMPLDTGGTYDVNFYADWQLEQRRYVDLLSAQAFAESTVELMSVEGHRWDIIVRLSKPDLCCD